MKKNRIAFIIITVLIAALSGCSTINQLEDYNLYGSRIAMDMAVPPRPVVNVDYDNVDFTDNPIIAVVQLGANIVKAGEAEKAERKLYSALQGLYIPEYAAELTFDRIVKSLDATMVQNMRDANLILEIEIEEYGLEASSWGGNVSMIFKMKAGFYHPADNETIWQRRISVERDLTPGIFGFDHLIGNVVSISALSQLEEEELAEGFKAITYDVMEEAVDKLRKDIRKSRNR